MVGHFFGLFFIVFGRFFNKNIWSPLKSHFLFKPFPYKLPKYKSQPWRILKGATKLSITTLSITTLSITTHNMELLYDTQHK
jgi:hypothetical protein